MTPVSLWRGCVQGATNSSGVSAWQCEADVPWTTSRDGAQLQEKVVLHGGAGACRCAIGGEAVAARPARAAMCGSPSWPVLVLMRLLCNNARAHAGRQFHVATFSCWPTISCRQASWKVCGAVCGGGSVTMSTPHAQRCARCPCHAHAARTIRKARACCLAPAAVLGPERRTHRGSRVGWRGIPKLFFPFVGSRWNRTPQLLRL